MYDAFKKGLRQVKSAAHSRSRSRTSRPTSTQSLATALDTSSHPLMPTTDPLPTPLDVPSIVVLPSQEPHDNNPNPDALPLLSTGEHNTKHTAWVGLKTLLAALRDSSEVFGPLKSAIGGLYRCVEMSEQEAKTREGYDKLRGDLDNLCSDLSGYLGGSAPPTMTPIIENISKSIEREVDIILQKQRRSRVERCVEAIENGDEVLECYWRVQTLLGRLTVNANMSMWKTVDEQTTELRLGKLPNAPTAMYRSTESGNLRRVGCTPNTRVDVLAQLQDWTCNPTSEKVYWLNGMAGTGKTTIAYSLCEHLQQRRQLGASFFCTRQLPECRNVNRIVPSISYQLSLFSLPFRYALSSLLEHNKDIHNQPLPDQFEQLVVVPLRQVADTFAPDVTIVIDALDECEDKDGLDRMLEALLLHASNLCVRFFVTSRPDPKILDQMRNREDGGRRSELRLHELEHMVVQQDVTTYLKHKLKRVKLSDADMNVLVERSGVLFIYAATVVRYLEYDNFARSRQRLKMVLGSSSTTSSGADKDLNILYGTILDAAFDDNELGDSERAEMELILRHVVCAQEPLSVEVIASLLEFDGIDTVQAALRPLLSVLNVSDTSGVVTTLHESFPNYLLNRRRSGRYYCDARQHNALMARLCFGLIKVPNPPFNICNLESSYLFDEDVPDMEERVNNAISNSLLYACRYWGAHIELASAEEDEINALHEFLSSRLLLWMEVLNLKKRISEGAEILHTIQTWCQGMKCSNELQLLVQDAYKFVAVVSSSPISRSTPHIYASALPFWPQLRPLSTCYLPEFPGLAKATGSAMSRQELTPMTIHTHSPVFCIAYSADSRRIAFGLGDGSIEIWDARTGQRVGHPLKGHASAVNSVAYSLDDTHLISGSGDTTLRIWDAKTGEMVGEPLKGHTGPVLSVACSPGGAHIISGSGDKTIRIWNRNTGQMVGSPLGGHTDWVHSVGYSPDGAYLASGSWDETICIWDAHTGQAIGQPLQGHTDLVASVAYSPDGANIASGSGDNTIRIWDARTGEPVGQPLEGHTSKIQSVKYSPTGSHIVSGSYDGTVCIWDARTGLMIGQPLVGHTDSVYMVSYSPDGAHIASCSVDQTIHIWDLSASTAVRQPLFGHTGSVTSVVYSPDGASIASGSDDKTICIWDAHTGKMIGQPLKGHTGGVQSVAYSPNGACIASASADDTVRIWDVHTGQMVGQPLEGHADSVRSVAYSPGGGHVASGSSDQTIRLWDTHNGKMTEQPLGGHTGPISSVAYSPDGAYIASGSYDNTIRIWDVHDGQKVGRVLGGHLGSVLSVAFSPNGAHLVSGSFDNSLYIWDASTSGIVRKLFRGHTSDVRSVKYSPDGAYIASASLDGIIRIWDAHTGQIVGQPFSSSGSGVLSVAFSLDGAYLVSGSVDNAIRVWRIHASQEGSEGDQPHVTKPCLCSVCAYPSDWGTWKLDKDGWVVTDQAEPLIWVPHNLRQSLLKPHMTAIISTRGSFQLDFSSAKLGREWKQCLSA
ncbi:hypothetical protein FS749_003464 [Ceratobasidium sp. UAMH 11750]|nr:hypothetical protein FS749_003464 [Ceratobasidium sp. UAMH 11750]